MGIVVAAVGSKKPEYIDTRIHALYPHKHHQIFSPHLPLPNVTASRGRVRKTNISDEKNPSPIYIYIYTPATSVFPLPHVRTLLKKGEIFLPFFLSSSPLRSLVMSASAIWLGVPCLDACSTKAEPNSARLRHIPTFSHFVAKRGSVRLRT